MSDWVTETVRVSHTEGLHIRPASKIVTFVQESHTHFELKVLSSPWLSLDSLLVLVGLGLTEGTAVELRATGLNAAADLNRLKSLF